MSFLGRQRSSAGTLTKMRAQHTERHFQELRRNRDELAHSERRIQDLEVEANLAGVPQDWRGESAPEE